MGRRGVLSVVFQPQVSSTLKLVPHGYRFSASVAGAQSTCPYSMYKIHYKVKTKLVGALCLLQKSPTLAPLDDQQWITVKALVPRVQENSVLDKLQGTPTMCAQKHHNISRHRTSHGKRSLLIRPLIRQFVFVACFHEKLGKRLEKRHWSPPN